MPHPSQDQDPYWLAHFAALDLHVSASRDEVKLAWRDLVKVWHPDRFSSDPRLAARCQEKLKRINEAFEALEQAFEVGADFQSPSSRPSAAQPADPVEKCRRCGTRIPWSAALCDSCLNELEAAYLRAGSVRSTMSGAIPTAVWLAPAGAILLLLIGAAYIDWKYAFWGVLAIMSIATVVMAVRFSTSHWD